MNSDLILRNVVTRNLEQRPIYFRDDEIVVHRCPGKHAEIAVAYLAGKNGLISVRGIASFSALLDRIAQDNIAGVMLTDNNIAAEGKRHYSFPGLDIKREFVEPFERVADGDPASMFRLLEVGQLLVEKIATFSKPLVGAVAGDVLGGGLEMLAFMHTVLGEGAQIAFPECGLNVPEFLAKRTGRELRMPHGIADPYCLFPGWHGIRSILCRMLERKTQQADVIRDNDQLVFQGLEGAVDSGVAATLGMIDRSVPDDEIFQTAVAHFDAAEGFRPRSLRSWKAPSRPSTSLERSTVGRRACDCALYDGSGEWSFLRRRDSLFMVKAMMEGLGAIHCAEYERISRELSER